MVIVLILLFFFKQKTAYEMRISDWSSDVCSSDLVVRGRTRAVGVTGEHDLLTAATLVVGADRIVQRRSRFGRDRRLIPVEVHDVRPRLANHRRRRRRRRRGRRRRRSEEHTSELQSLMRTTSAVICLKKNTMTQSHHT